MAAIFLLFTVLSTKIAGAVDSFQSPDHTLKHMVMDTETGHLVVGAVNKLYRLSPDLNVEETITTGPKLDSMLCQAFDATYESCTNPVETDLRDVDNVNKLLVVDKDNHRVLTCGTLYQGVCEFRNITNLSNSTPYYGTQKEHTLAPNVGDDRFSAVAFIGPGPTCPGTNYVGPILYAGQSNTYSISDNSELRKDIPAYSSHRLQDGVLNHLYFNAFSSSGSFKKLMSFRSIEEDEGVIQYISGFSYSGYSYFFTIESDESDTYVTKLVRICQNDCLYKSYVEVEVSCVSEGTSYNLVQSSTLVKPGEKLAQQLGVVSDDEVLIATFSNSSLPHSYEPDNYGAVCIFTFRELNDSFVENLRNCYRGNGHVASKFYETDSDTSCVQMNNVAVTESFCYNEDDQETSNLAVSGAEPLSRSAAFVTGQRLTSVAVDLIAGSTVAFFGTHSGHLIKVELLSHVTARQYSEVVVEEGVEILRDMSISLDRSVVYAMTSNTIHRVAIVPGVNSSCNVASTCSECKDLGDPYCGWCSLEKKCSQRSQCENYSQSKRWLSYGAWECLKLNSVNPKSASLTKSTSIELNIEGIPPTTTESQYQCVFGDSQYTQQASLQGSDLTCPTPIQPAPIEEGKDSTHLTLYIRSTETEVRFLETDFDFYHCQVHSSCSACASALWNCHWCVFDNRCYDSSTQCDHDNKRVVRDAEECPMILPTEQYLIPVNVAKEFSIPGSFLPEPVSGEQGYQCVFYVEGKRVAVPATREDDHTVKCQAYRYSYSTPVGELTPTVEIQWNNNFVLETNSSISVTLYKCHVLGQDCSQCLGLNNTKSQYNCKFCDNVCSYGTTCTTPVEISCPDPNVSSVKPLSGPKEGGTVLTIRGENLGTKYEDVKDGVKLGSHACEVIKDKYEVSTKIECSTSGMTQPQNLTLHVNVKRGEGFVTATYLPAFQYKDPQLMSIEPAYGPLAGGTLVTIRGHHLQTGEENHTEVTFGSTLCKLVPPVDDNRIVCITQACENCDSNQQHKVTVKFDKATRQIDTSFIFKANPVINSIQPTKVFLAGGRAITVKGANLNVVQKPLLYLKMEDQEYLGNCSANENGTTMLCQSPQIRQPLPAKRARRQTTGTYVVGFKMDGVESVEKLAESFNVTSTFDVVPDPEYEPFENGKAVFKPDTQLLLKGTNLNLACTISEVDVDIGKEKCLVRTLDSSNLYCDPPKNQPSGTGPGELPLVVVKVGNLRTEVGSVEYAVDTKQRNEVWIIGVAVGGGFLLTLIIVILVVYVRKSTQADRQYKKLKMQLDTLESNVRNECKQAFAELQTEVSDFTSDISVIGIPMWDYKTYTFKVLFPSHSDHPVLHNGPEYLTNKFGGYDQGLHQFSQLLNSKHFMLIFIRTLEQQKNFSIRDKAVVASLLMIVLQDKMEYATDILKALMNELIDKSVEKKHPKLMLRRTESVVEKLLTNWLSVCMYSYLKKHAGKELFMLYQAITRQTEKGPVDAIHSEARYSLSEDRLLREKIEPKILNINLVTDGEREPVTCRCLDCDTVTQAKQKALNAIYLNTPFSNRPSVYDVDLEWRSGKSGHLPLQDEDVTTEVVNGWKKVNTLAHYHVPDGAVMALVQKRIKSDGVRMVHGKIEIVAGSNSTIAPIVTIEEGQKVWHLVKHDDGTYVSRNPKVISEIFLTRLLATKGTLQQYIDELFLAILRVDSSLPPAIKWLFDFLDTAAKRHSIYDPDVVHTWKSNSLPLRFWVNIIKNPEFVFDIHKSHITDSCLSVIAQTFMDSCSTMEHRLGKDSPSNKLLFAKDIPRYRSMVSKFYKGIQEQPAVSDQDMNQIMTEMSLNFLLKHYTADFNVSIALKELFKYAHQYNFELLEALDEDPSARKFHLANKFEEVTANLEGDNY